MTAKRNRKFWSYKEELLTKSREAMLSAVQIFNNPSIHFKSETFIVLSNIAWMYLAPFFVFSNLRFFPSLVHINIGSWKDALMKPVAP